ncbi:TPA: GNAT family N-acetyltransferase [Vibrio parahaemolyticus]|nr:GNAT family N-acetyltransferase [Vibrio parahaemolyticus]
MQMLGHCVLHTLAKRYMLERQFAMITVLTDIPSESQLAEINEIRRKISMVPNSVLDRFEPLTTAYWDYVAVVLYYKDLSLTGYVALYRSPSKIARNELELSVFVAPEYQNFGIGKLLIKQAINVAKSFDSVDEVTIMVKRKLGLEGYYKEQGFSCSSSSDNSFSMSMKYPLVRI